MSRMPTSPPANGSAGLGARALLTERRAKRQSVPPSARPAPQRKDTTASGACEGGLLIGNIRLQNRLMLAPMAGVTDRPFRTLCRRLGAGLAVSEMVSANPALAGSRNSRERTDHRGEPGPIAVQIAGADPHWMAEAARLNVDRGAELIDINLGCPAKKVCKAAAGSSLLRDEPLVARILEAVVAAVDVPVTLKTRTGWSPQTRNLPRIAHIARESGIALLAVHGRTRACGYGGRAELDSLRALRARHGSFAPMRLVANGDITSPEYAAQVLAYTGADGIMIGRAAQGRPWLFREIQHYLATGSRLPPPPPAWICATLLEHLDALYRFYGTERGLRIARKHIAWYLRGVQDTADPGDTTGTHPIDSEAPEPSAVGTQQKPDEPARLDLCQVNRADTPEQQIDAVRTLLEQHAALEDAA